MVHRDCKLHILIRETLEETIVNNLVPVSGKIWTTKGKEE